MTTTIIQVPLKNLVPGDKAKGGSINSRKADAPIDGLAKSIAEHGLIVPLLVRSNVVVNGDALDRTYFVIDGNRRLQALRKLHKKDDAIKVPCIDNATGNALELSMVVNVDREELHPVDRFEVFAAMIEAGDTVDAIAKRYGMTVKHVRQALALGRMAPAIRDAWRNGTINAETAEAFTLTTDHKAQAAAFRKVGKHASEYQVRQILAGGHDHNMPAMLAFVGKTAYEKAGYEVNQSLFLDEDNRRSETVSDIAALKRMTDEKIQTECDALVAEGWKWAVQRSDVPYDFYAWKRIFPDGGRFTKEQMSGLGCVLEIQHDGKVQVVRGYVKPGDKIALPKSPKQKKAEAKAREQHKEETGGISNALAFRLSKQLTEAVRQALSKVTNQSAVPIAIAMLASGSGPSKIRLGTEKDGDRHGNDFVKYLHLAMKKSQSEAYQLLAMWVAQSVDLTAHRSEHLACALHPGKENDLGTLALVEALPKLEFETEMLEQFDAADYFASVGKELIVQAVRETMGKEHADKVAKMKASEARDFAAKNIKGWVPPQLRLK